MTLKYVHINTFGNSSQQAALMEAQQNQMELLRDNILMYMQTRHHDELPNVRIYMHVCMYMHGQRLPTFCTQLCLVKAQLMLHIILFTFFLYMLVHVGESHAGPTQG